MSFIFSINLLVNLYFPTNGTLSARNIYGVGVGGMVRVGTGVILGISVRVGVGVKVAVGVAEGSGGVPITEKYPLINHSSPTKSCNSYAPGNQFSAGISSVANP